MTLPRKRSGKLKLSWFLSFLFITMTAILWKAVLSPEIDMALWDPPASVLSHDVKRLCVENPYISSLSTSIMNISKSMDDWLMNIVPIEKDLVNRTRGHPHTHDRFHAFEPMGSCMMSCMGGACKEDRSKIVCGNHSKDGAVSSLSAPCVVYSIGSANHWGFELDILKNTPCEVHTFDCTGPRSRFNPPNDDRLYFHHICLGTSHKVNEVGEFWTLDEMTSTYQHNRIDLLKVDIEGYEWPLLQSWPELDAINAPTTVLPMQVLVEVHYQSQFQELAVTKHADFKFATDMISLQAHLLRMGYAVIVRDDNKRCLHCSELTLVRIRCPEIAYSI